MELFHHLPGLGNFGRAEVRPHSVPRILQQLCLPRHVCELILRNNTVGYLPKSVNKNIVDSDLFLQFQMCSLISEVKSTQNEYKCRMNGPAH